MFSNDIVMRIFEYYCNEMSFVLNNHISRELYSDSMAERSKAPVSGTGHLWRGFESHYCQISF